MSKGHRPPKGAVHEMIATYGQPQMTSVDVGANVGEIAHVLATHGPVTCIEPDPRCWDALRARVPTATVIESAVGDAPGVCVLFQAESAAHSSLREGAVDGWATSVSVPVNTLDALVTQADLVKIDAQGGEVAILRGAPTLLASCPVWIFECWPVGLRAFGDDPLDLVRLCEAAGLSVQWADGVPCTVDRLAEWLALDTEKYARHVNLVAVR